MTCARCEAQVGPDNRWKRIEGSPVCMACVAKAQEREKWRYICETDRIAAAADRQAELARRSEVSAEERRNLVREGWENGWGKAFWERY